MNTLKADRIQFAFTAVLHYLFTQLTMDRDLTLGSARDYKEILSEIERASGAGRLMS